MRTQTRAVSGATSRSARGECQQRNMDFRREDLAEGRVHWRSRPSAIEFGTNSACNLKCPMCAHAEPNRAVINAPRDARRRLYEEVLPALSILKPYTLSEPMLTDLEELVPYLEEHGTELDLVTNAALLTRERLELILPHLHRIAFSIDSHVPEIYDSIRIQTNFEIVDRNIKAAMPLLREQGVLTRINMVLNRVALPHLESFVDYVLDEYGIDYIDVFELVPYMESGRAIDPFLDPGPEVTGAALERMIARAKQRGVSVDLLVREPYAECIRSAAESDRNSIGSRFEQQHQNLRKQYPGVCEQVLMYMKIQADGSAFPCCVSPKELFLGNVFRDGLDAVWNSRAARRLRRRMVEGDYPEPCKQCLFLTYSRSTVEHERIPLPRRAKYLVTRTGRRLDAWLEPGRRFDACRARGRTYRKALGSRLRLPKLLS